MNKQTQRRLNTAFNECEANEKSGAIMSFTNQISKRIVDADEITIKNVYEIAIQFAAVEFLSTFLTNCSGVKS